METSQYTRKGNDIKEDEGQIEDNEKVNSINKSKSLVMSTKRSDEFERPHRKCRKKYCDWMKFNSDTYCPNIEFLKEHIVADKSSAPDLARVSSR